MRVHVALLPAAGTSRRRRFVWAIGWGLVLSLAIETLQYFIPARYPGATDLVMNSLGAGLGGLAVAMLLRRQTVSGPPQSAPSGSPRH